LEAHHLMKQLKPAKNTDTNFKLTAMKYPEKQYFTLVQCLKKLAHIINVAEMNVHTLHFVIYQQFSDGQKHNWLYCTIEGLKKRHQCKEEEEKHKLIDIETTFDLYPEGCNDTHIETAMKKAFKELGLIKK
jgi:hypothetical protein